MAGKAGLGYSLDEIGNSGTFYQMAERRIRKRAILNFLGVPVVRTLNFWLFLKFHR